MGTRNGNLLQAVYYRDRAILRPLPEQRGHRMDQRVTFDSRRSHIKRAPQREDGEQILAIELAIQIRITVIGHRDLPNPLVPIKLRQFSIKIYVEREFVPIRSQLDGKRIDIRGRQCAVVVEVAEHPIVSIGKRHEQAIHSLIRRRHKRHIAEIVDRRGKLLEHPGDASSQYDIAFRHNRHVVDE